MSAFVVGEIATLKKEGPLITLSYTTLERRKKMSKYITYCDNCADPLEWEHEQYFYAESPIDFDSGNKGESAVFCIECHQEAQKEVGES